MSDEPDFKPITCTTCGEDFMFALSDDVAVILVAKCPGCDGGGVADIIGQNKRGEFIWEGT